MGRFYWNRIQWLIYGRSGWDVREVFLILCSICALFHLHRLLWFSIHLHRLLWFEIFLKLTWLRYIIFSVDFNEIQRSNFERHPLMKSCRTNYEIYWSVAKHSDRVKTILICLWLPNYNSMTADFITFI